MKKFQFSLLTALTLSMLASCKRKDEPNKLIDPLPVSSTETCTPGQLAQAWFLIKRDMLSQLITTLNKSTLATNHYPTNYPGLSNPSANTYSFQTTERHYGTATVTFQFKDDSGTPIDPIQMLTSTTAVKSAAITITGGTTISYNESLVLTLDSAGLPDSTKRLTGTSTFNGLSSSLNFTITSPGMTSTFEGLTEGNATASGTGSDGGPATLSMNAYPDHSINGKVTWQNQVGGIHFQDNGAGYVVTSQFRILLD